MAELFAEERPTKMRRVGMRDRFGESGEPEELLTHFGMTQKEIIEKIKELI